MQQVGQNKRFFVTVVFLLECFVTFPPSATAQETPESAAIGAVASVMGMYSRKHNGIMPTRWDQIKAYYDVEYLNGNLIGRDGYPLEDHYQFITQPLPLLRDDEGQVLLIRTVPLGDRKQDPKKPLRLKRRLIYQRKTGDLVSIGMDEEKVQAMLKKAGITITPKAGLPAVEYDTLPLDYVPPAEGTTKTHPRIWHDPPMKDPPESPAAPTAPANQPKVSESVKPAPSPFERSDHGWLVWLVVVLVAAGGAAWMFLRKLK